MWWKPRRILCDWQMPDFLETLELDVDRFAEVLQFTAKSAFGNSLYPTRIGRRHPIDGIMLDITYWHAKGCFCEHCASEFERRIGYALGMAGAPGLASVEGPGSIRIVTREDDLGWLIHLIRIRQESGGK